MKTYKDIKIPGLGGDDYDEIWQRGYDAGYESGYTDGLNDCPGPKPYNRQYLTIEALEDGDFNLREMDYSINDGPWETASVAGDTISLNSGDKVRLRGLETNGARLSGNTISFNAYGNVLSLKYGDSFQGENGPFNGASLFKNSTGLVSAKNLILPTTLATDCYLYMFDGCTSLTSAPSLPATNLATRCYNGMFNNCTSLETAPELPATTLVRNCYSVMFSGCASLTTAPVLPATTLADYCYWNMFSNCTSLTSAPELPATTLANNCYFGMFSSCKSLTSAPELPATTLVDSCYRKMFYGCTNLNYVKCVATDISASNSTTGWLGFTSSTGTFVKAVGMNDWERNDSGIPIGWTVIEE